MNGNAAPSGGFPAALRTLRRAALRTPLVLVALFLVLMAVNASDERPTSEALTLLHPAPSRFKPQDNIYLALSGFDAPAGQSATRYGQAAIARYDQSVDLMLKDPLLGPAQLATKDPQSLQFVGSVEFCRPLVASLWEDVRTNAPKVEPLIEQNRELYQRYLALFGMPGYYETARPSTWMPLSFSFPVQERKLFLAHVILGLQSTEAARVEAAVRGLRQDMELWHRVLVGEGSLVSKMVAVAYLQIDSLLVADMVADPRTVVPGNVEDALPQFELTDWNIGNAFAAEFRFEAFVYAQVQVAGDRYWLPPGASAAERAWNRLWNPVEMRFYKHNATVNLSAKRMNELAVFGTVDPATFAASRVRFAEWRKQSIQVASVRTLYNPIGKTLVAVGIPSLGNYILRPYDAAALQRLARLSFEIRSHRISPSAVAEFMQSHPEWSTHPADGRPFLWGPVKAEIAVQPVAKQPADRRFSVAIWQQPAS